jgi:hypothetical protein
MKKTLNAFILFVAIHFLFSCETRITPTLESAPALLVVDAWITNRPVAQEIILTRTQPYFENQYPPAVKGATVQVTDNTGKVYSFIEDNTKSGHYIWKGLPGETFGAVGQSFQLQVVTGGETFGAVSAMGRVPAIDSIVFSREKRIGSTDTLTLAEFYATDPKGKGDAYWIRAYKNGSALDKPSEINFAFDAGFSPGGETDGVVFITPIRRAINPNRTDSNNRVLSPYDPGDSVNVQIHSITLAAYNYLNEVAVQTDRPGGFQELFAAPLANVSTNIKNSNPNGSAVVGFFNVSAVSSAGKKYQKK